MVTFSTEVYVKIANLMLSESHSDFNDEIKDVGAELINIIMGSAKPGLNEFGLYPEMATPTTIQGEKHSVSYLDKADIILVPFSGDFGNFTMEICYSEL